MKEPPKIVDSCAILSVFNIKIWKGPHKTVDPCAYWVFLTLRKWERPSINSLKIEIKQ